MTKPPPQPTTEEWEKEWYSFWKPLLLTRGKLDEEKIKNELHDLVFIYKQVSEVYEHITGGQLSKPMYYADVIKTKFDDEIDKQAKFYAEDEVFQSEIVHKAVQQERERCLGCVEELLDSKYPYRFVAETSYGQGQLERGVQMDTYIRRKGVDDDIAIGVLEDIRNKIKGGDDE